MSQAIARLQDKNCAANGNSGLVDKIGKKSNIHAHTHTSQVNEIFWGPIIHPHIFCVETKQHNEK